MKKSLLILFLLIPLIAFGQNLIQNPGFESWTAGAPDDWTTVGGSITLVQNTANAHGGSSSCEVTFTSTSNQDLISNEFAVIAGRTINVSVWINDNDAAGRARLSILYTGASNYYGDYSVDSPDWQELTYSDVVPDGATAAQFQVRFYDVSPWDGDATLLVDDASFEMVATTALTVSNISREFKVPTASQSCFVQCDITGGTTPYTPLIQWSINGASQTAITMTNSGGDTYQGTIPVQANGDLIEYFIDVTDAEPANVQSSTTGIFWGTSDISNAAGMIKETDADGALLYKNYYARIAGVATVGSGNFSATYLDAYLQDAVGGIDVYRPGDATTVITPAENYTIVGHLDQYAGKAELVIEDPATDLIDDGPGTMPEPVVLTIAQCLANPEAYEGMLVGIQHVSNTGGGDAWPAEGSSANVEISDDGGTNVLTMRIDNDTDIDGSVEPSWPVDLVCIFSQYDGSSPYTEGYQVFPRALTDFRADGSLPVTLASFSAIAGNKQVILKWITESEVENVGFEIMRASEKEGEYTTIASYKNNQDLKGQINSNSRHDYQYSDGLVANGFTYWYKLVDVDLNGKKSIHGPLSATPNAASSQITKDDTQLPQKFALNSNYPNPFNPNTAISFDVPALRKGTTDASLIVYNALGQKVKVLYEGPISPGTYTLNWNGQTDSGMPVPSGLYFAIFTSENFTHTIKMTLMK